MRWLVASGVVFGIGLLLMEPARGSEADQAPTTDVDRAAQVEKLFETWNKPDSPGCAVGIIRDGELIFTKGYGVADLERPEPITPQTIFEIASAAKSFTSACIALLMDQGKLRPDDLLSDLVPEMHRFDPPVRLRHLIQCRTGLWEPFHILPLAGWDNVPIHSPVSGEDVLTVLCGQRRLPFEPGSQYHYGSGDYVLLGWIVKKVSGRTLAEFARENLFEPLGMRHTFYEEDSSLILPHRAVGHLKEKGVWHQWRVNAYCVGGCGVKTCVEDLARWDRNFDENRLPRGKYFDEFLRTGTLLDNRNVLDADAYKKSVSPDARNAPAGEYRGLRRIQFTGGVWGMTASISRYPDQRFTVICLSNNDELSPFGKTREIAEIYLGDRMHPHPPAPEEVSAPVSPQDLQNKVGAYRIVSEGRIWKVALSDGNLQMIDPIGNSRRLEPVSPTRFRPVEGFYPSARFWFERPAADQPYNMTLESYEHGFHEVLPFVRIELVEPSRETLAGYEGEYVSDELAANYRFTVKENSLWVRVGSRRWEQLDATVADEFYPHVRTWHDNRIFRFERSANGRVSGLTVVFWRVKGLHFDRR